MQISRAVRFYTPVRLPAEGGRQRIEVGPGGESFWAQLAARARGRSERHRTNTWSGVASVGEARRPRRPANPYIYVARIRPPADSPDLFTPGQGFSAVQLPGGGRIAEPTFLVPFGLHNRVAVMSPTGRTPLTAIEAWITAMLGVDNEWIELEPMIDPTLANKLESASGGSYVSVRVPGGAVVPQSRTGGRMLGALSQVREATDDRLSIEVSWSFGHAKPGGQASDDVVALARAVSSGIGEWADAGEVRLQIPEDDGYRIERHDLARDRLALQATFVVPENEPPTESAILSAIVEKITEVQRRL